MDFARLGKGLLEALACQDCARYVLNACRCRSACGECCEVTMETEKVDIPAGSDSESELSVEVERCCHIRSS